MGFALRKNFKTDLIKHTMLKPIRLSAKCQDKKESDYKYSVAEKVFIDQFIEERQSAMA